MIMRSIYFEDEQITKNDLFYIDGLIRVYNDPICSNR